MKVLDVSDCGLTLSSLTILGEYLKNNKSLTELFLSKNGIEIEGMNILIRPLRSHISLKILDLSHNELYSTGALVLSPLLKENH